MTLFSRFVPGALSSYGPLHSSQVSACVRNNIDYDIATQGLPLTVPAGSPSRGGDVTVYVVHINQPSLPTPFYSVLVSVSFLMALSTIFHSINSPDNSLLSHSVLLVLFPLYWSFQLYSSL